MNYDQGAGRRSIYDDHIVLDWSVFPQALLPLTTWRETTTILVISEHIDILWRELSSIRHFVTFERHSNSDAVR